jgi:hypothetical protein
MGGITKMGISKTFTDDNGKRGRVGSYVCYWLTSFSDTEEEKRQKSRKVEKIIKHGSAGTFLGLENGGGLIRAKDVVIVDGE